MVIHFATLVVVVHSALMMCVELAVFAQFPTIFAILLAFVAEVLHAIHVELEFENVQFNIDFFFVPTFWRHRIR